MVLKFQYLAKGLISILLIVVLLWHTPTIGSTNVDLSGNGVTDLADLIIFAENWLDEGCAAPVCEADLDEAGNVTMSDFAIPAARCSILMRILSRTWWLLLIRIG